MARSGVVVDESILVIDYDLGRVAEQVVRIVGSSFGYQVVITGPTSYQFSRRFRSTATLTVAWLATLLLFGGGLLLFLIRTTEVGVVSLAPHPRGTQVRVSGRLHPLVLQQLRSLSAGSAGLGGQTAGADPVPEAAADRLSDGAPVLPPVPGAPTPAAPAPQPLVEPVLSPAPAFGPQPAPPPDRPGPLMAPMLTGSWADAEGDGDVTIRSDARSRLLAGVPVRPYELIFDTGERVRPGALGLVGRDPSPQAGEAVDILLKIDDPHRSVSKTHFAFGLDGGGLWVVDRMSTNGVWVLDEGGQRTVCPPGTRVPLAEGKTVVFGERRFVVRAAGCD